MTTSAEILTGDALERLRELESSSFDAMLTDPPYGLAFMGKRWDYDVPSVDVWREALRVLKPGAHALIACGTRTQHRMAVNVEDAGFEIRDVIAWIYGSGFPKSHDVSKAIDRAAGAEREDVYADTRPNDLNTVYGKGLGVELLERRPATPEAARWVGYGTALKPAMELWTLVRRPLEGTVAQNALEHGVGGLNVDGTRIPIDPDDRVRDAVWTSRTSTMRPGTTEDGERSPALRSELGRWPANVTHDGSAEVLEHFPDVPSGTRNVSGPFLAHANGVPLTGFGDAGSAARFFYCAKADAAERDAGLRALPLVKGGAMRGEETRPDRPTNHPWRHNPHPTVKPLALAAWLATLLLPPARDHPRRLIVPFSGSGSELIGARLAGWDEVVGIELDPAYADLARARLDHHVGNRLW